MKMTRNRKFTKNEKKKLRKLKKDYETFCLKLTIVGDTATGKSCALIRFCEDRFQDFNASTIGVDFKARNILVDKISVKFLVWDTDGDIKQRKIISEYIKGAAAVLLFYNSTNKTTFDSLTNWIDEIRQHPNTSSMVKILVGCWCDKTENKMIPKDVGYNFAKKHDMLFIEVSGKTGENIENLFKMTARNILRRTFLQKKNAVLDGSGGVYLSGEPTSFQENESPPSSKICTIL